jgi:DNA polymerase-3 subunit delta
MAKQAEKPNNLQLLKNDVRNKQPQRLYVFHGEETFLLDHYLQQLKRILVDDLTESFNFHKLTNETFDIRTFADCVENENTQMIKKQ